MIGTISAYHNGGGLQTQKPTQKPTTKATTKMTSKPPTTKENNSWTWPTNWPTKFPTPTWPTIVTKVYFHFPFCQGPSESLKSKPFHNRESKITRAK